MQINIVDFDFLLICSTKSSSKGYLCFYFSKFCKNSGSYYALF